VDLLDLRRGGDAATIPFASILFVIICSANFRQKSNVGSGFSLFTRPSLPGIHLHNRQQESKLPVQPPLCLPSKWIMTMIINFINPVLTLVVPAEGFRIPKGLPLTVHAPPG